MISENSVSAMREGGYEPPSPEGRQILSLADSPDSGGCGAGSGTEQHPAAPSATRSTTDTTTCATARKRRAPRAKADDGFPPVGDFASGLVPLTAAAHRVGLSVPDTIALLGRGARSDDRHGLLYPENRVAYYAANARPIPVYEPRVHRRLPVQIYAIRSDAAGAVKIGQTKNVQKRLAGLQQGTDAELSLLWHFDGAAWVEADILRRLAPWRKRGEWFHPSAEVLEWVVRQGRYLDHTIRRTPRASGRRGWVALEAGV